MRELSPQTLQYRFAILITDTPLNRRLYHYANNNPLRYVDPDGEIVDLSTAIKKDRTYDRNGNYIEASHDRVLAHELAGHVIPKLTGINGNAIQIENRIAEQMNWFLRAEDPNHVSF